MLLQVLKSKLKSVVVTDASVDYEGSLTLDPVLMDAAGLFPYERVEVNGINKSHRLVTYVMPGHHMSGQVEMNGAMANFFQPGDRVHVNCFKYGDPISELSRTDKPIVVVTDDRNMITEIR